jgi:hypothetical protein
VRDAVVARPHVGELPRRVAARVALVGPRRAIEIEVLGREEIDLSGVTPAGGVVDVGAAAPRPRPPPRCATRSLLNEMAIAMAINRMAVLRPVLMNTRSSKVHCVDTLTCFAVAGYSGTPLAKKLGLKDDLTVLLSGAPDGYKKLLDAPRSVRFVDEDLERCRSRADLHGEARAVGARAGRLSPHARA